MGVDNHGKEVVQKAGMFVSVDILRPRKIKLSNVGIFFGARQY